MHKFLLPFAIGAAALVVPAQAQAKNVTADPNAIIAVMQKAGYRTELTKDGLGDPLIWSSTGGYKFGIFFYSCTDGKDCLTVQFSSGFDTERAPALSELNKYIRENRWGRIYLDEENDPIIEMDLDLEDGGMTEELFLDNIEYFEMAMGNFAEWVFSND